jgi:5-methylcytosine-specific restriction endonuclease McrA
MARFAQVPQRVALADTRLVRMPPKLADKFYLTPEWRALMRRLIEERGRRCEKCGRSSAGGQRLRIFGDHIHELKDGGAPLDPQNISLLCGSCHTAKTAAERTKRTGGFSTPSR